jgi:secondary thiamine-phosphate synthase enzyme
VKSYNIRTSSKDEFVNITESIKTFVNEINIDDGLILVYVPHTTAGVTINEGADPAVKQDILNQLSKIVPENESYQHMEGNSDGHIKASFMGSSAIVPVSEGGLALGTWQSVYFCEFDGPRQRKYYLAVIK